MRCTRLRTAVLLALLPILTCLLHGAVNSGTVSNFKALGLAFEPNVGQAASSAQFLARQSGMQANFSLGTVEILLPGRQSQVDRLQLDFGSRAASLIPQGELPGRTNYLHGNDPAKWHTNIANYSRLRYTQLYPGIDLVFYGNGEHLEHDFVLAPGAHAGRIHIGLNGAERLELDKQGNLLVHLPSGIITFQRPYAYQDSPSGRRSIPVRFQLRGWSIGFRVGHADKRLPLTIDPVLSFSTFLSGSNIDVINGMALDASGNIYVAGHTFSPDFPTASPAQPFCASCSSLINSADAFVSKLDPTGSTLIYSTFIGGELDDSASAIAVAPGGIAVISGSTTSPHFPAVNPIGAPSCCNNVYAFTASLSADGTSLIYSGILGVINPGANASFPVVRSSAVAIDSTGNAYITGDTASPDFPITAQAIGGVPANPQSPFLFVSKISPTGALLYSTAIPGKAAATTSNPRSNTFIPSSIVVDIQGNAYVGGQANDGLPATTGVIGTTFAPETSPDFPNPTEGFILKLNPTGSGLVYASYVPATLTVNTLLADAVGNAYIGGDTSSAALPVSANAFQKTQNCVKCDTGYILEIDAQAAHTLLGTYLGGGGNTFGLNVLRKIASDTGGNIYAIGAAGVGAIPMRNALLNQIEGFVAELTGDLSTLLFSSGVDESLLAISPAGKIILAGNSVFPSTPGAFQPVSAAKLFPQKISAIDLTPAAPAACLNPSSLFLQITGSSQSATLTNCGNADLHISGINASSTAFSANSNCPTTLVSGAFCTITVTLKATGGLSGGGGVVITDDAALPQQSLSVSFVISGPILSVTGSLSFPDTLVGTIGTIKERVGPTSEGTASITFSSITTTGDFQIADNDCSTLGPFNNLVTVGCTIHLVFNPTAPGQRNGTLVIADNTPLSPHIVQLQGLGLPSVPVPTITNPPTISAFQAQPLGGGGQITPNLIIHGDNLNQYSTVFVDGSPFQNLLINRQEMQVEIHTATDMGELPMTIINSPPGGGRANGTATVYRQAQTVPNQIFDGMREIVFDPHSQLIYATVSELHVQSLNLKGDVVAVDPLTGLIVKAFQLSNSPRTMAVSDDGQFLYVSVDDLNSVAQVSLATGTVNFVAPLGSDAFLGPYRAQSIRVLPGQPHSWVASLELLSAALPLSRKPAVALKVFDDATARAQSVENGLQTSIFPSSLVFVGNDASTLFAADKLGADTSLYRFTITASGIALHDKTANLGGGAIDTDGASLYVSTGIVVDPVTLTKKGAFALTPGLAPQSVKADPGAGRVFFLGNGLPDTSLLQAFDTKSLALSGTLSLSTTGAEQLQRWGTNGLAFVAPRQTGVPSTELDITRSSITGTSAALPTFLVGSGPSADVVVPPITIPAGGTATFQLTALPIGNFSGTVMFSCLTLPPGSTCSASPGSANIGPASSQVTFSITTTKKPASVTLAAQHPGYAIFAALAFIPLGMVLAARRRGRMFLLPLVMGLLLIFMASCGGGGGGQITNPPPPPPPPPPVFTPAGTYTVTVQANSGANIKTIRLPLVVQ